MFDRQALKPVGSSGELLDEAHELRLLVDFELRKNGFQISARCLIGDP
jgi:hypothetical protein